MVKMFDFTGRVAFITGGSSGLGFQFAKALAGRGCTIAMVARRVDRLEENKKFIEDTYGVECFVRHCDVTDKAEVKETVEEVFNKFGRIDILINNAGIRGGIPAADMTDEEFMEVINTNEVALYTCAREVGKHMIEAGYGRIINIASLYGIQGKKGIATVSYSTAKGGVANFTRALACEWGEYGITVNCIAPGYFPTELMVPWIYSDKYTEMFKDRNPIGRYGRMEEVNSTIIYLAAEESSYITGVVLPMDGGWTAS